MIRSAMPTRTTELRRTAPAPGLPLRSKRAAGGAALGSGGVALSPVSARRKAKRPARRAVVAAVFARDANRCQAAALMPAVRCAGALDAHEVIPRSAWPGGELVVANVVAVCRRHHDAIGANPATAHALGLHGFSWERPA